jgi:GNAT superfamily N-acetyltransferase
MSVRAMRPADLQDVLTLRLLLWPDDDGEDDFGEKLLVWEQDGMIGGFVAYSVRPWADGCNERPVYYVEGWFVREELRGRGIGRALIAAVEDIARAEGRRELGSDALLSNRVSLVAHRRLGFEPTEQVQFFRKTLHDSQSHAPGDGQPAINIEPFTGPRPELLPLFEEADDSATQISSYMELGEVLVARRGPPIIGHVQLIAEGLDWEIKSLTVADKFRGQGIGSSLVQAALTRASASGAACIRVATATADLGNLRFYQRLGFRMDRVERNAFTTDRGYPDLRIDEIPVRDRVWLSISFDEPR